MVDVGSEEPRTSGAKAGGAAEESTSIHGCRAGEIPRGTIGRHRGGLQRCRARLVSGGHEDTGLLAGSTTTSDGWRHEVRGAMEELGEFSMLIVIGLRSHV